MQGSRVSVWLVTILSVWGWAHLTGCSDATEDAAADAISANALAEMASQVERDDQDRVVKLAFLMNPITDSEFEAIVSSFGHGFWNGHTTLTSLSSTLSPVDQRLRF